MSNVSKSALAGDQADRLGGSRSPCVCVCVCTHARVQVCAWFTADLGLWLRSGSPCRVVLGNRDQTQCVWRVGLPSPGPETAAAWGNPAASANQNAG